MATKEAAKKKTAAPKKESDEGARGKREVERGIRQYGGLQGYLDAIAAGKVKKPRGKAAEFLGETQKRQAEQTDPKWAGGLGGAIRQVTGGLDDPKFRDVAAFGDISDILFPASTFAPMEQDQKGEALAGKYEGNLDKSIAQVDKGIDQLDEDRARLSPELDASLKEVAKGAVADPMLMAESAKANVDADAFLAQAEKERQIDPIQQAVYDEMMKRSQGFTPEEKAAYLGQLERSIGLNQQAAQRQAASAGQRGIQGGLAHDLQYKADQDALMARAAGREGMVTKGRELGDTALKGAGEVAGVAVGQAGERQAGFAKLGAGRQQDSGNILQGAVKAGQDLYGHNINRSGQAMTGMGNIAANKAATVNAGTGAINAASNFFNPYLANRQDINFLNKELPFKQGQVKSNFILGGLGFATDKEAAEENRRMGQEYLTLAKGQLEKEPASPTTNVYNYTRGSDAGLK